MNDNGLLSATLMVAVPLWVERLRAKPWSYIDLRAEECSHLIAEKGDVLQFGGGKKGEAAKAFNALAEGLAILSFFPGGVKFAGQHWESSHPAAPNPRAIVRRPTKG